MLKGTKSTTLNYQVMIGETPAIYITASIPETGKSTCTKNIVNLDLYEKNKAACRADMAAFDAMLWELEDQSVEPEESAPSADTSDETEGTEEAQS